MNPETVKRIEAYLKRTLNPGISLMARPRVTDSVEVQIGGEHVGLVYLIEDEGAGLPNRSNLFVPFYTTKPGGTGVGLVLSRQIAEAHGGTLTLDERGDRPGCRATLRIPI